MKLQRETIQQKFDGSFFASQNIKNSTRSLGVTFLDALQEFIDNDPFKAMFVILCIQKDFHI